MESRDEYNWNIFISFFSKKMERKFKREIGFVARRRNIFVFIYEILLTNYGLTIYKVLTVKLMR